MANSKEFEELVNIIAITRYPKAPEQFITADEIAEAIISAGFIKDKPPLVTRGAINAALMAYHQGITTVAELHQEAGGAHQNANERMARAIYAAISVIKNNRINEALEWTEEDTDVTG